MTYLYISYCRYLVQIIPQRWRTKNVRKVKFLYLNTPIIHTWKPTSFDERAISKPWRSHNFTPPFHIITVINDHATQRNLLGYRLVTLLSAMFTRFQTHIYARNAFRRHEQIKARPIDIKERSVRFVTSFMVTRDISLSSIYRRGTSLVYFSGTQHPRTYLPLHEPTPRIRVTEISVRTWSAIGKTCDRYFSVTTLIEKPRTVGASHRSSLSHSIYFSNRTRRNVQPAAAAAATPAI